MIRSLLLALGLALAATSAFAQNGLQRFEKEIRPQLEVKKLTYGSASALGSAGFVLNDVVAVLPPDPATGGKETTLRIEKVTVDELDFDRLKAAGKEDPLPRFAKLKLEGMTGDDALYEPLAAYGVPKAPIDLALDYRLDTTAKVLTLAKLEINLRGQARVAVSAVLDRISDKASQVMGSKDEGQLRTASLDLDDTGLIAKLLPGVAKAQGTSPEMLLAMATVGIASLTNGQGPATMKALDALASYAADWKQPNGPIRITIKPAKTAGLADIGKALEPNALVDIFGLNVDYAGTRAGAAGKGVGAGTGAVASAGPPATVAESKKLTGGEAALSLGGHTLTGKFDGDVIFELYRKDGTTALLDGADTTAGKWSIQGEKLCTKYPDEEKDCYAIVRTGDDVTLTEPKGKVHRMKVLTGNPKNL